jgi:thioredoxin
VFSLSEDDPELQRILDKKLRGFLRVKAERESVHRQSIRDLDGDNFKDFVTNNDLAVVEFWAPWCAPCYVISPILEELALEYKEVVFGKLDVDSHPRIAEAYGIMGVPSILFFKNGRAKGLLVGLTSREEIEARLEWLKLHS